GGAIAVPERHRPQRRTGSDVDNGASAGGPHHRRGLLCGDQAAAQVDRHEIFKDGDRLIHHTDPVSVGTPCIVDEDIETAEPTDAIPHHLYNLLRLCHVDAEEAV